MIGKTFRVLNAQFLRTTILVILSFCVLGLLGDIRFTVYTLFISLVVAGFFPFLIILCVIAALMLPFILVGVLVGALFGGELGGELGGDFAFDAFDAGNLVPSLNPLVKGYYKLFQRQTHPVFWGVIVGSVVGLMILASFLYLFIVRKETVTLERFASLKVEIEAYYQEHGHLPKPNDQGFLTYEILAGEEGTESGSPVLDGFKRPIQYEVAGKWKIASYRLTSLGYEVDRGEDDLCFSGGTTIVELAGKALDWVRFLDGLDDETSVSDRISGLTLFRCENSQ